MARKPSGQKQEIIPSNTLYLSTVPQKECSIPSLFQHFKNYGHIRSIYAYGTNAVIAYDTVDEGIKAFRSSEAYANNRFVHYRYHRHPETAESLLSVVVDKERVSKVLSEVRANLAQEQKRLMDLQQSMRQSQTSNHDNSEFDLMQTKEHIIQKLQLLNTQEENDQIKAEKQKLTNYLQQIEAIAD